MPVPLRELSCPANTCGCDREQLHSAAQELVGARICPHAGDDAVVTLEGSSVGLTRGHFDFRAVNRLADMETVCHLLHLFFHLSSAAFDMIYIDGVDGTKDRPEGSPTPYINAALLRQASNLLSSSGRAGMMAEKPFRLSVRALPINNHSVWGSIGSELDTLRQYINTHRVTLSFVGESPIPQMLALIADGRGMSTRGIREVQLDIGPTPLYSSFVDTLVEVGAFSGGGSCCLQAC